MSNYPQNQSMKRALFPGSFDPITIGHEEIVERGAALFDEVLVAIGVNSQKKYLFSLEERLEMLRRCFAKFNNVKVGTYTGLTVDYAKEQEAFFLLRGLRSETDLAYERPMELINKHLSQGIETVYLFSRPVHVHVSSTLVREVIKYQGKVEGLVPNEIVSFIREVKYQTV